jgi:hypothetical protein
VSGGAALELQHIAPQIVERINGHLGYHAIDRLKLVHAPMPHGRGRRARRPRTAGVAPPADPKHWPAVEGIADPGLKESLQRLGAAIAARESKAKQ